MASSFLQLGVPKGLVQGLEELGIRKATGVQEEVIPYLMDRGRDLVAQAQTGTGKTAAFGVPLLTKVSGKLPHVQAVVLAPTRELAKQVGKALFKYCKYSDRIFIEVLSGGDPMNKQVAALKRPTQIVVATPGRLIDLVKKRALDLSKVQHVVLDEADEMLSMGFKDQLKQILDLAEKRQATWLFSATYPDALDRLVKTCMAKDAKQIIVQPEKVVNRNISHYFKLVPRTEKADFIDEFLEHEEDSRGLIFCRTKAIAISLCKELQEYDHSVDLIQGEMSQKERDKVMRAFKKERVRVLIATDVAARGIDVEGLEFVIHHQLPDQLEYYTHRSGRTARAGKKGISLALVEPMDKKKLGVIAKELHVKFSEWG